MKKSFMLFAFMAILGFPKAIAQLPEVSTDSDPIWYYIQVLGEEERAGRVFTVDGTYVYGRALINSTNQTEVDTQLWRFEKNGNYYDIISKSTGKKLDFTFSGSISQAIISDAPVGQYEPIAAGDHYQIKITQTPTGGSSGEVFLHQANNGGNRNYAIMLVSNTYSNEPNSYFNFVVFEDFTIEYSEGSKEVWYNIKNGKEENRDKVITDITTAADQDAKFSVATTEDDNDYQLWKLVKNSTDQTKVELINKATGNIIQTSSKAGNNNPVYNYIQFTQDLDQSTGWTLSYLGLGQYVISAEEEDGIIRYLNSSSATNEPSEYDPKNAKDTEFAWIFSKADKTSTPTLTQDNIRIYSLNKRIVVESDLDYTITNIQGQAINKSTDLNTGIYLVTVNGKTTKVFVK